MDETPVLVVAVSKQDCNNHMDTWNQIFLEFGVNVGALACWPKISPSEVDGLAIR